MVTLVARLPIAPTSPIQRKPPTRHHALKSLMLLLPQNRLLRLSHTLIRIPIKHLPGQRRQASGMCKAKRREHRLIPERANTRHLHKNMFSKIQRARTIGEAEAAKVKPAKGAAAAIRTSILDGVSKVRLLAWVSLAPGDF